VTPTEPKPARKPRALVGPPKDPWTPYTPTKAEVYAVKAVLSHKADEEQQRIFVGFLNRITGIGDLEFRPEGDRATVFASGKRFVGMQVHKIGNLSSEYVKKLSN
jgi:hypothetical protein